MEVQPGIFCKRIMLCLNASGGHGSRRLVEDSSNKEQYAKTAFERHRSGEEVERVVA
jgi:hypothetical protein